MNLRIKALLLSSLLVLCCYADDTKSDAENQTTTQPPPSKPICELCKCQNTTKTLNCSSAGLSNWITDSQWAQINNTFDILLFDHNNFQKINLIPNITVKKLIFSHNQIQDIEQGAFKNLQQLTTLDLSHNNLTSQKLKAECFEGNYSPSSYEPIPKLAELNLAYNDLHTLDQDLFEHMPELEKLILNHNEFKVIDHQTVIAIASIQNLKFLDMSYLGIKEMPQTMFHSPRSLTILNLKGNLFKKLPAALLHAINLIELYLDNNPLEDLVAENIFPLMPKLEILNMTQLLGVKKIGKGAFSGLTSLKELNMEGCIHLQEIDADAFSRYNDSGPLEYPPVEYMNLKYNNLSTLQRELLAHWDSVNLKVGNNSWDCECSLEWFLHVEYPAIRSKDRESALLMNCTSPPTLKNVPFEQIYQDKNILRCPDTYGNHPENDGKLLMGLLIGLLIAMPIAMGFFLIYKRGCFGLFDTYRYDHSRALYKRASSFNDDY